MQENVGLLRTCTAPAAQLGLKHCLVDMIAEGWGADVLIYSTLDFVHNVTFKLVDTSAQASYGFHGKSVTDLAQDYCYLGPQVRGLLVMASVHGFSIYFS